MLSIFSDILLGLGALFSGGFCLLLGIRLKRFSDLDRGVGGAISVLSAQVEDLSQTLAQAEIRATDSADVLQELTERAEKASRQLECMLAASLDLPDQGSTGDSQSTFIRHDRIVS